VSGKGVPASLFMAVTRNLFRIIAQQGKEPAEIATEINSVLSADNEQGMFVTMFIAMADLKTGVVSFCNCGHNPPVIVHPGKTAEFIQINNTNLPLGIWEGGIFTGESLGNIWNDRLLLYTDGLNEAENAQKELLGNDAVLQIMTESSNCTSTEIIMRLQMAVEEHRAGASPNDDLTLLCVRLTQRPD
jgi:sigma-B regulation protein RsbU (phosphoserine phosphatase)